MNRCPMHLDIGRLRTQVRDTYDRVALSPESGFHFNTGAGYAIGQLGYDPAALDTLPATCRDRFAGVGNPLQGVSIAPGSVVLDHACGAGMDLLLAARAAGPSGRAVGVDLSPEMRACALRAAAEAGLRGTVEIRDGNFEDLPLADASVDVVISNGVLNLAPDKRRVVEEIVRVLRPGGRLLLADVVVDRELAPRARADAQLWASCVGGALTEAQLLALLSGCGLAHEGITHRYDCFARTALQRKLHRGLEVRGVRTQATRPR